jgi:hypothetical protein
MIAGGRVPVSALLRMLRERSEDSAPHTAGSGGSVPTRLLKPRFSPLTCSNCAPLHPHSVALEAQHTPAHVHGLLTVPHRWLPGPRGPPHIGPPVALKTAISAMKTALLVGCGSITMNGASWKQRRRRGGRLRRRSADGPSCTRVSVPLAARPEQPCRRRPRVGRADASRCTAVDRTLNLPPLFPASRAPARRPGGHKPR